MMSVHQIIYTSCRRGINGGGDGLQIYSMDAAFQGADEEELGRLFSYQHPDTGCPMTDELARTMPQAYKYQRLSSGDVALAQNTYLGRDYMGKSGRFGYHMSHVIVCDPEDMKAYPAEYCGGELLRSSMTFDEVNSPETPSYLPEPNLETGPAVSFGAAADFLIREEGRMDVYKQMLCAVLSFDRVLKRVVILDKPENIIFWAAALGYALPRRNALEIGFSTYEYAPALSPARVCGAVRAGTRFGDESQYFVFDLLEGNIPSLEPDPAFSGFIDDAFSFSHESLLGFHDFLNDGYDYGKADEDIYQAYALYAALDDGPEAVPAEQLAMALDFAGRFAREDEIRRIAYSLLQKDSDIVRKLLEAFDGDAARLTDLALTLEGVLRDRPEDKLEVKAMWDNFRELLLSRCPASVEDAYAALGKYKRGDQTYPLYRLALSRASGPEECRAVYEAHDRAMVRTDPEYAARYGKAALEAYRAAQSSFLEAPAPAGNSIFKIMKNLLGRRGN